MRPDNKVVAGALAGALTVVIAWVLQAIWKISLPPEVAAAASTILTFAVQWTVPDRPDPLDPPSKDLE